MDKSPDAFRTISEVAGDLDLPQHVLRFWETRFAQIKPLKRGGGRRYYRPDDVELLKGIRHLLYGEGYTIRGVQRILKEQGVRFVMNVWHEGAPQPSRVEGGAATSPAPGHFPEAEDDFDDASAAYPDFDAPEDFADEARAHAPEFGDRGFVDQGREPDPRPLRPDPRSEPPRFDGPRFEGPRFEEPRFDEPRFDPRTPLAARLPAEERVPVARPDARPDPRFAAGENARVQAGDDEDAEGSAAAIAQRFAPRLAGGEPGARPQSAAHAASPASQPSVEAPVPRATHVRAVEPIAHPLRVARAPAAAPAQQQARAVPIEGDEPDHQPRSAIGALIDKLRPHGRHDEAHAAPGAPRAQGLSRDEIRRLQSTLFELLECKRLLDQVR